MNLIEKIAILLMTAIGLILTALFWSLIFGWLGMIMWNFCMPVMFGLPQIGFWHMFVFIFLVRLILPDYGSKN